MAQRLVGATNRLFATLLTAGSSLSVTLKYRVCELLSALSASIATDTGTSRISPGARLYSVLPWSWKPSASTSDH